MLTGFEYLSGGIYIDGLLLAFILFWLYHIRKWVDENCPEECDKVNEATRALYDKDTVTDAHKEELKPSLKIASMVGPAFLTIGILFGAWATLIVGLSYCVTAYSVNRRIEKS